MQLGFVGLGKMGLNMVTRLSNGGHQIVAYDRDPSATARAETGGRAGRFRPRHARLGARAAPRRVGDGAGRRSDRIHHPALADLLSPGDVIIDGGNTNFHDDLRRAESLGARDIHYVDAGTSGGVWGLTEGYCLMVGGEEDVCGHLEPIFLTLAPEDGYLRVGGHGAGHYVKMVHNGIEYGLMQAYAEGFELLHESPYRFNVGAIASLWLHGSVVRSWLLELGARALAENPELAGIEGYVEDSGEGRWTLHEGIDRAVPLPVLTAALFARFRSRQADPFSDRLLAALRNQFGGHSIKKRDA